MTGESRTFHVGQEVEVTYRARVAEVTAGGLSNTTTILRLEPVDGSYNSPPGGWIDPSVVGVTVTREPPRPMPTRPGMYWTGAEDQSHMGTFHTDGREFHYLNVSGEWVDVGWGQPSRDDVLNGPLVETPF